MPSKTKTERALESSRKTIAATRAKAKQMSSHAAGAAGSAVGGYAGGRFYGSMRFGAKKTDLAPFVGAAIAVAGLSSKGAAGLALTNAGAGFVGATMGVKALLKRTGTEAAVDAALEALKKK